MKSRVGLLILLSASLATQSSLEERSPACGGPKCWGTYWGDSCHDNSGVLDCDNETGSYDCSRQLDPSCYGEGGYRYGWNYFVDCGQHTSECADTCTPDLLNELKGYGTWDWPWWSDWGYARCWWDYSENCGKWSDTDKSRCNFRAFPPLYVCGCQDCYHGGDCDLFTPPGPPGVPGSCSCNRVATSTDCCSGCQSVVECADECL